MKVKNLTHEDVQKLYSYLSVFDSNVMLEDKKITNRNFGVKDYTVSSNTAGEWIKDEMCDPQAI